MRIPAASVCSLRDYERSFVGKRPGLRHRRRGGEHFVLFRLHERGLIAALAPQGAHQADIIVFSPEMSVGSMVQVKTRTRGRDGGWHMSVKHEGIVHDRLFYAFVDLEPTPA